MSQEPTLKRIGRYQIQSYLSQGAFGRVFRAFDPIVGRPVAIKILAVGGDKDLATRFRNEAAAAGNLHHKNIVIIYEYGEQDNVPYIAMEYLDGQTLQEVITRHRPLTILEKMSIMSQVAAGLDCAHKNGVVHRDVKPANIMLLPDGMAKIMDFGIARLTRQNVTRLTQKGDLLGTLFYMAPEQFQVTEADALCDIFAYGVIYYELLAFKHPFDAPDAASLMFKITGEEPPPIRSLVPDCPEALERLLQHLLAKDRDLRYQSFEEVLYDSEPLLIDLRRQRAEELVAQAEQRFANERLDEAQALVREALELDPANRAAQRLRRATQQRVQSARLEALLRDGDAEMASRRFAEALEHYESAARLDRTDRAIQARIDRAHSLQELSRQSGRLLEEARKAMDRGDLTPARDKASEAARIDPDNPDAGPLLETVQQAIKRRETEDRFKELLGNARGLLLIQQFDKALATLAQLDAETPGRPEVAELTARVRAQKAEKERRQFLQAEMTAARELLDGGRIEDAIARLEPLGSEFSQDKDLQDLLRRAREELRARERRDAIEKIKSEAQALSAARRFQEAVALLEQGLRSFPGDNSLFQLLESTHAARSAAEREQALRDAVERGGRLRAEGHLDEAIHLAEISLRRYGADPALDALLRSLREEWEQQQRQEAIRKAVDSAEEMLRQGRQNSAIVLLREACMQFPGEESLGKLLARAEEELRARERRQAVEKLRGAAQSRVQAGDLAGAREMLEQGLRDFSGEATLTGLQRSVEAALAAEAERRRFLDEQLARATQLERDQQYADALAIVESALARYRDAADLTQAAARLRGLAREAERLRFLDEQLAHAAQLEQARQYPAALSVIEAALARYPDAHDLVQAAARLRDLVREAERLRFIESQLAHASLLEREHQLGPALAVLEKALARYPDAQELLQAAGRLRDLSREADRRAEFQRQIRIIEAKIAGKSWTEAMHLTQAVQRQLGSDPALDQLLERTRIGRAQEEEERRRLIRDVFDSAARREQTGDLRSARALLQEGQRRFPDASEFEPAIRALEQRIRDAERRQQVDARVRVVEERLSARQWDEAVRAVEEARAALGADPVFDSLLERIRREQARQEQEKVRAITAVLGTASEAEQRGDLPEAWKVIEEGMRRFPDSTALSLASKRIQERTLDRERRQKIAERVASIEQILDGRDFNLTLSLTEAALRELGTDAALEDLRERAREGQRQATLSELTSRIEGFFSAGNLDLAASALAEARKAFPGEASLQALQQRIDAERSRQETLAKARNLIGQTRYDKAEAVIRDLLARNPADPDARELMQSVETHRTELERRPPPPSIWEKPAVRWGAIAIAAAAVILLTVRFWPSKPIPRLVLADLALGEGKVGEPYSQKFSASGGVAPYRWAPAGALPPGLTLDPSDGSLAGTPTANGRFEVSIRVSDHQDHTAEKSFGLSVQAATPGAPLTLLGASLAEGKVGSPYSHVFAVSGGAAPYEWTPLGALPPGLALDAANGSMRGTPAAGGKFDFSIRVSDSKNNTSQKAFSLSIREETPGSPLTLLASTLADGKVGEPYSYRFAASGGAAPYRWTVHRGALPSGLTLDSDGALHGAPAAEGKFAFAVRVSDRERHNADSAFSLVIRPATPVVKTHCPAATPVPFTQANYGDAYDGTIRWRGAPGKVVVIKGRTVLAGNGSLTADSQAFTGAPIRATAAGAKVLEPPSPQNGWSCMAFEPAGDSVIINWKVNWTER